MVEQNISALKTEANKKVQQDEQNKENLVVDVLINLKPLKLPAEVTRDAKKLEKFLEEVSKTINKLIRGT